MGRKHASPHFAKERKRPLTMRKFKTESKKLLDLMINSIYTNREIFLRELVSNASDAVDKLYFRSLTDKDRGSGQGRPGHPRGVRQGRPHCHRVGNGIGMTKDELDKNLGTIAHSDSLAFKTDNAEKQGDDIDIIGSSAWASTPRSWWRRRCAWFARLWQRRGVGVGKATAWRATPSRRPSATGMATDVILHAEREHRGRGRGRRGRVLRHVSDRVRPEEPHQALQQLRALPPSR